MHAIRCRLAIVCLLLLAAPVAAARPECKADTANSQPRTMFSKLRIAALHVDEAASSATVNRADRAMLEFRFAAALCRWPAYTLAGTSAGNSQAIHTGYVVSGTTYHPELYLQSSGWELERRWRNADIFHPMIAIGTGRTTAEYRYAHRNADGIWENHSEGKASSSYVAPWVGVEASLFKYVTAYLLVGTRMGGEIETPGLEAGALKGQFSAFGFGFGKFR